jgi:hypothetical protein
LEYARLNKAESLNVYAKARPKAFTVVNINSSWAGAGLYLFQPRKAIRRVQSKTPSPSPPQNIFESTLLSSSPSICLTPIKAMKALFQHKSTLHIPDRLGKKAEGRRARMAVLELSFPLGGL